MLPPVGATLSALVEYPTASRSVVGAPAAPGAAGETTLRPLPANLLSGSRIDLLSLSSGPPLAQGLPLLLDMIGDLLKVSRMEDESLVDYALRLLDALKALSVPQRASLEQSLAQLARGTSLRILLEILKNPGGAEAKHFPAFPQPSPPTERDLLARAVVTSYRQNGEAESRYAPPASDRPQSPSNPVVTGGAPRSGTATEVVLAPNQGRHAQPATQPASSSPLSTSSKSPPASGASASDGPNADNPSRPRVGSQEMAAPASHPTRWRPGIAEADPAKRETTAIKNLENLRANQLAPPGSSKLSAVEPTVRESAPIGTPGTKSASTHEGSPLARIAHRLLEGMEGTINKLFREVLLQPASGQHAAPGDTNAPAKREAVIQSSLPVVPESEAEAGSASPRSGFAPPATPANGATTAASITQLQDAAAAAQPAAAKAGSGSPATQLLQDPTAFVLAAPLVAREGYAQVFLAYPPAALPAPEDEKDIKRVSAVDEDGGGSGSSQGDTQSKDERAEDDEPASEAEAEGASVDGPDEADHAQDLYARLADLT